MLFRHVIAARVMMFRFFIFRACLLSPACLHIFATRRQRLIRRLRRYAVIRCLRYAVADDVFTPFTPCRVIAAP